MEIAGATSLVDTESEIQLYDANRYFQSYISKTYFKTASMISLGCRGLGLVLDLDTEA